MDLKDLSRGLRNFKICNMNMEQLKIEAQKIRLTVGEKWKKEELSGEYNIYETLSDIYNPIFITNRQQ